MTARHKLLIYCVCLQYIRLFILQAFLPSRRRDCHATLACINPSKTALSFEKHYILASLVKGEVLLPERIRATTGGIATSLLPKPHYPSPCTTTLASLVKGRWLDGKAQTVALLRFTCDTPAFFNLPNLSAVKTEGLHSVSTIILIGVTWSGSQPPDVL